MNVEKKGRKKERTCNHRGMSEYRFIALQGIDVSWAHCMLTTMSLATVKAIV
jgi:hypothetical protein